MIEDTQIGKMVQPNLQQQISVVTDKFTRKNGGNSQLDHDRSNMKNVGVGSSNSRISSKKPGKNYKHTTKREQTFSKNSNKMVYADRKKTMRGFEKCNNGDDPNAVQNLINFQYAPATRPLFSNSVSFHGTRRKRSSTFNKEAFLQANCHFVVNESEKYGLNTIDPDVLVDWNHIQLVYLPSHDAPTCPICLYPPTAAKITRCGHVFCWNCMLHYLNLGDKHWRKCPICHEAVHEKDLKSVVSCVRKKFARLDTITMKLMRRSKETLFALPISEWKVDTKGCIPVWEVESFQYGYKLALSTEQAVLDNILLREQVELKAQLSEAIQEKSGEECFIQAALEKLQVQINYVKQNLGQKIENHENEEIEAKNIYGEDQSLANMLAEVEIDHQVANEGAFTDEEEEADLTSLSPVASAEELSLSPVASAEELSLSPVASANFQEKEENVSHNSTRGGSIPVRTYKDSYSESSSGSDFGESRNVLEEFSTRDTGSYYFYQADDGQNIFVHSLNARCLIEEYGSLAGGPENITGQIIEFECFTMTKELRRRFRYLSHLPLSCEFVVCELMLRPPYLSKHTIHNFMPEFKKRKEIRLRKVEEQRKFDRRASALINKQEGYRVTTYEDDDIQLDLNDTRDFPQNISPDSVDSSKSSDVSPESPGGPSFAQILSTDGLPHAINKTSVWGKSNASRKPETVYCNQSSRIGLVDDDDDGLDIVAPSFKDMFCAALLTTPIERNENKPQKCEQNEHKIQKSGKKKKNKGTLLFATGGQRKY